MIHQIPSNTVDKTKSLNLLMNLCYQEYIYPCKALKILCFDHLMFSKLQQLTSFRYYRFSVIFISIYSLILPAAGTSHNKK